jgi:hypothetical protein
MEAVLAAWRGWQHSTHDTPLPHVDLHLLPAPGSAITMSFRAAGSASTQVRGRRARTGASPDCVEGTHPKLWRRRPSGLWGLRRAARSLA